MSCKLSPDVKIFRHKKRRGTSRHEVADQMSGAAYINYHYSDWIWFHPANEGKRSKLQGDILTRCGMKKGVSDFIFIYPLAVIELKRECGTLTDITKHQRQFLNSCSERGIFTAVCFGYDEFINALKQIETKLNKLSIN